MGDDGFKVQVFGPVEGVGSYFFARNSASGVWMVG